MEAPSLNDWNSPLSRSKVLQLCKEKKKKTQNVAPLGNSPSNSFLCLTITLNQPSTNPNIWFPFLPSQNQVLINLYVEKDDWDHGILRAFTTVEKPIWTWWGNASCWDEVKLFIENNKKVNGDSALSEMKVND